MQFVEFAAICNTIEETSSRLATADILAEKFPSLTEEELPVFVRFMRGKLFPDWSSEKLGFGPNLLYDALAYVIGKKRDYVVSAINNSGDVGKVVESLLEKREQTMFFSEELDLLDVNERFLLMAKSSGRRSQQERLRSAQYLLSNATPLEGRYLARLMLEEMRIGVGEGVVKDAVAKAFGVPADVIEHAHQALNDLGEVATLAKSDPGRLTEVHITAFRPVKMMLAQQGSITSMVETHGKLAAENKYDGSRFQFHKSGGKCAIYSRRLEEMTASLPDVVEMLDAATTHDVIIDGEVIAIMNGKPMPFQTILRRIRRKHDIGDAKEAITLLPWVFDILAADGETLIDQPFFRRRQILESVMTTYIAPQIVSDSAEEIEAYYHASLDSGNEGIMLKVLDSPYLPGNRGKLWIKIKPEVDTIDLVVTGAEWGEGKRAKMFGSFLLACQDENGDLLEISRVATGIDDSMLSTLYDLFKEKIIAEKGKTVSFEPDVVFEVGYAELQRSTNYAAGYALRFPRFVRLRDDKDVYEIETLESLTRRYSLQNKEE
ncbi:MAG: ATP-dependent DNA ligase [Methanocorpusculum sp.]|uniref:ATP-dependent DNA ligase n=1 Tax=Methanocorpusculum sp. TaxID=2058474 RepID=UPI0027269F5B|nr:ATP-dependent DNA ligase [Methanocorpusculum sp.]MDO9523490.1 ATP-dependent DNA ligase [Methanocorpusculum sp.]